jgi:hypothetical protein
MDKWIKRVAAKLLTTGSTVARATIRALVLLASMFRHGAAGAPLTSRIVRRQQPAVVIDLARARQRRLASGRRPTLSGIRSSPAPKAQHHGSRRGGSDGEARIRP